VDLTYPPEAEAFRDEVRAFLAAHLPPGWRGVGSLPADEAGPFTDRWRRLLHEAGLLGVAWPREYGGRGLSKLEQVVLVEELAEAGAPAGWDTDNFSLKMIGNTLLALGTREQKARFLPRALSGEHRWCQGFSEPGAGSDLAALSTRARLEKGERPGGTGGGSLPCAKNAGRGWWHIDGQKIWTSNAREANWIFLLARTSSRPRHRGLTFLLCPLDQPGIEIRPITMITGHQEFNEVFFSDAVTAADNVIGEVDGGWAVAQLLLGFERGDEAATNPILFRRELDRLTELARQRGRDRDPAIRARLASCLARVEVMRYLGYRILTGFLRGGRPGPEASVSKLYWSEYHRDLSELAMDILDADGVVPAGHPVGRVIRTDLPGAPNSSAAWSGTFLAAQAGTIYAGTSDIQRNLLAESVLGLPREPRPPGA
jgi:alkylation response protein AidB-like acyl-CoA dehydrogenase